MRPMIISIYLFLPAALGSGVYSVPNRNEYKEQKNIFLGSGERLARRVDALTTICEPIV
jgi:hypothetical protein